MERFLMDELVAWKDRSRRKPLILNGARQVGKRGCSRSSAGRSSRTLHT